MALNLNSIIGLTNRVSSTAKAIFKGSANARQEMSALKTAEFFNSCEKDLFINGGVSKNQIETTLKKLCPGLNVNVKNNYSDLRNGAIGRNFSENTVIGYDLKLPFSGPKASDVVTKDNVDTLMHEVRHLMDFAYNPKYTGRANTIPAFNKFKGYATRSANYSDFYQNKIYASYSDNFGENLKNIFVDKNITPSEKIEVLQSWRHRIKTEINAFSDGIKYENKYELNRNLDEINWGVKEIEKPDWAARLSQDEYLKHYKNVLGMSNETHTKNSQKFMIDERYAFNQKLSQIEEMLGAEIKKERKRVDTNLFLFGKP